MRELYTTRMAHRTFLFNTKRIGVTVLKECSPLSLPSELLQVALAERILDWGSALTRTIVYVVLILLQLFGNVA